MKDVQCYELFGGIALKNHAFSFLIVMKKCTVGLNVDFDSSFFYFTIVYTTKS